MSLWIPVTLFAAVAQNMRFMLQRHLKITGLSTAGATWSRFVFSAPLVVLIVASYGAWRDLPLPALPSGFWLAALTGGTAQILGTMCVVALFAYRSFAIGITFMKTEVLQTALIGLVILGEGISPLGVAAIAVGFVGVVLLSDPPRDMPTNQGLGRLLNRGVGLGLASGALFGVSAVGYRAASLSLDTPDVLFRAGVTLAVVTSAQSLGLGAWLAWRQRDEIARVLASWRVCALVGLTSMLGSFAWFLAFSLQNAAYVKALGQVELVFSFLASWLVFGERTTRREGAGVALVVISVLLIVIGFI